MPDIRVSKKYGVNPAIPKCYYCWEDKNEIILPGRIDLRSGEQDVEAPQGAVWDMRPCDKCEELMAQGVILISIRDDETPPPTPPPLPSWAGPKEKEERMRALMWNPYRTGGWVVMKDDAIRRIFGSSQEMTENILKKRYAFVANAVFLHLGLPLPAQG